MDGFFVAKFKVGKRGKKATEAEEEEEVTGDIVPEGQEEPKKAVFDAAEDDAIIKGELGLGAVRAVLTANQRASASTSSRPRASRLPRTRARRPPRPHLARAARSRRPRAKR